ncbi:MAG: CoA-transferase [Actinomycetota bacterium]
MSDAEPGYTPDDMMTVAAARALRSGDVCFVGIGLPSTAANLARRLHAPGVVLIYESGCIGAKPTRLPSSIGDGVLAEHADVLVGVPEIFSYWLQAGRIDIGFLGAAQIDRFGNLNTTVIGPYEDPTVRLPGAGGAPEIAANCRRVIVTLRHSRRTMVDEIDFVTSIGHGSGNERSELGIRGEGPVAVITDLGIMRPDPTSRELVLTDVHPGVPVSAVEVATGWPLRVAPDVTETDAPSAAELEALAALRGSGG